MKKARIILIVILAVALVTLVACGNDNGDNYVEPTDLPEEYELTSVGIIVNDVILTGVYAYTATGEIWPTHVPVAQVAWALDAEVTGAGLDTAVEGLIGTIFFELDSNEFMVNGETITLRHNSIRHNGNIYVPISFFSEAFGGSAFLEGGMVIINADPPSSPETSVQAPTGDSTATSPGGSTVATPGATPGDSATAAPGNTTPTSPGNIGSDHMDEQNNVEALIVNGRALEGVSAYTPAGGTRPTHVPLVSVALALGATEITSAGLETVVEGLSGRITVIVGSNEFMVNGETIITLQSSAIRHNNEVHVPISFFSEVVGGSASVDGDIVHISR